MLLPGKQLNLALADPKVEVMNFLNEVAQRYPDAISFAPGRPLEELFDVADSIRHVEGYVAHQLQGRPAGPRSGYAALGQYGRTNGVIGGLIAELLKNDDGIELAANDIVVTVGAQEGMCLCLVALVGNPDDVLLVVDPAYIGISGAARLLGIEVAAVPADGGGVDLAALERIVSDLGARGKNPRLLYLSPDFANPTGITTPPARRAALLELTRRLGLVVLEDHAYNYFHFDGEPQAAPLKAMPGSEHVIYLGSFAKSIYPGLRLGFVAAGQQVELAPGKTASLADEISKIKSLLTVNTSPIIQAIVGGLLLHHGCSLKAYVEPRRRVLQENRDAMLAALEASFPQGEAWAKGICWNRPSGGFFLSLKVPFDVTDADLQTSAERYGTLWTPMSYFFVDAGNADEIRLSFSYVTPAQIQTGIAALARFIQDRIAGRLG